jgi:hypothetical protein
VQNGGSYASEELRTFSSSVADPDHDFHPGSWAWDISSSTVPRSHWLEDIAYHRRTTEKNYQYSSVADPDPNPDPHVFQSFWASRIRIRIH